jgi:hypothetical protein
MRAKLETEKPGSQMQVHDWKESSALVPDPREELLLYIRRRPDDAGV